MVERYFFGSDVGKVALVSLVEHISFILVSFYLQTRIVAGKKARGLSVTH